MSFKRTEYTNDKQITALASDINNSAIWVAFDINVDGSVILERQSAFDPVQSFFSIDVSKDINGNDRTVTKIVDLDIYLTNIYACYNDTALFGEKFSLTNALSSRTEIEKPVSVIENPIGITANANGIFILTPGNASATDAEVHVFSLSGTFDETIVLTGINNAISLSSDDNDEVWVVTNNSPSELIRIFPDGGSSYNTETTILN